MLMVFGDLLLRRNARPLDPQSRLSRVLLTYVDIGVVTLSPWALLLALPLAVVIHYGVGMREGTHLK
jgi:hypothetical protein